MRILLAFVLLLFSIPVFAQVTNYGFESGNYTGWTVSNGSTTARTSWSDSGSGAQVTTGMTNYCPGGGKCWTVTPYGQYMVSLQAGGSSPQFNNAMTTLGLQSSTITSIRNTIYSNGNMHPTNATSISRTVFLQAGITYTYAWQYVSTDYVPYNDGSMITLTGGNGTPTINGQTQNFALLGFTNEGTGNYSVGSYGATGWQVAVFTVPTDGNYLLGFASFNLGDTALSPILFIDQMQGTTSLNGTTFTPVEPNAGSSAPPPPPPPPAEPTYPTTSISTTQTTKIAQTNSLTNNSVYIQNYGDFTSVTIDQIGGNNSVRGVSGAQSALINGNSNTLIIKQGQTATPGYNNLTEVSIIGSNNTLSIDQKQNNKYVEANIASSSNNASVVQQGDAAKSAFINLTGGTNNLTLTQQGAGQHFVDITAPTSGNTISITQDGSAQKLFSLTINSPNVGVTVSQTNATTADSAAMSITCTAGPCTGYSYIKN
jgi:hypothetical protein